MHPNPLFRDGDEEALLTLAAAIGFAHVFTATPERPMVAHVPVARMGPHNLAFHVAKANRITPHLNNARVLLSIAGPEGYVSPNWYTRPGDQVPTWNYIAIEVEGRARPLDEAALIAQLDALAAEHEPRVNPELPWTRGKMADAPFRTMLKAIQGFAVEATAIRGTVKVSQNKPDADRAGVAAGLERSGNDALAVLMRT